MMTLSDRSIKYNMYSFFSHLTTEKSLSTRVILVYKLTKTLTNMYSLENHGKRVLHALCKSTDSGI